MPLSAVLSKGGLTGFKRVSLNRVGAHTHYTHVQRTTKAYNFSSAEKMLFGAA